MSNNSQCVPGTKFRLLYCNLFQILPFTIRLTTKRAYINLKIQCFGKYWHQNECRKLTGAIADLSRVVKFLKTRYNVTLQSTARPPYVRC